MPDDALTLPATVVSAHLRSCAADLAAARATPELPELALLLADLVAGQQRIAAALARWSQQLTGPELAALAEVLGAAATATGHAAAALAESRPVLDIVNHDS